VATTDANGVPVVGKLRVTVGENRIVMLPDGQLVARPVQQAEPTSQAFEPATKAALAAQLRVSQLSGFQTKETRRYLYVYNCSEPFAEAASRILETMFRGVAGYAQMQELPVVPPETQPELGRDSLPECAEVASCRTGKLHYQVKTPPQSVIQVLRQVGCRHDCARGIRVLQLLHQRDDDPVEFPDIERIAAALPQGIQFIESEARRGIVRVIEAENGRAAP
jgi:hypothetical protein